MEYNTHTHKTETRREEEESEEVMRFVALILAGIAYIHVDTHAVVREGKDGA